MPKLWRAPIPIVRITAPQITATQKLRCCGLAAASDESMDMGRPNSLRVLPQRRTIECICAYMWEAYTFCPDRSTAFGCCAGIYEGPAQRRLWVERTPSRESGFVRRRLSVIAGTE